MGPDGFVGINWGSSNFRAYRVNADGSIRDERTAPAGVAMLDREGMTRVLNDALVGWEDCGTRYATGMIGSNIGWTAVPYVDCPASMTDLSHALVEARIGDHAVLIVPGLACTRMDDMPDILRGEEMELFGALACAKGDDAPSHVVLPGTHTKWVSLADGAVRTFMTAMSGEIYDRMTSAGLLASVVSGAARPGDFFTLGVEEGMSAEPGLTVALFSVRARVIRGKMPAEEAASYLRGLLIGSEIGDALRLYPDLSTISVPLIGNAALCELYKAALSIAGCRSTIVDARHACVTGLAALHELRI